MALQPPDARLEPVDILAQAVDILDEMPHLDGHRQPAPLLGGELAGIAQQGLDAAPAPVAALAQAAGEQGAGSGAEARPLLQRLYGQPVESLQGADMSFQMLLPADEAPLEVDGYRTEDRREYGKSRLTYYRRIPAD